MSSAAPTPTGPELEALLARLTALESRAQARDERIELLEEENRWLKAQLFGRSSEKSVAEEFNPEQAWLFNEAEALARAGERRSAEIIHDLTCVSSWARWGGRRRPHCSISGYRDRASVLEARS